MNASAELVAQVHLNAYEMKKADMYDKHRRRRLEILKRMVGYRIRKASWQSCGFNGLSWGEIMVKIWVKVRVDGLLFGYCA